MTYYAKYIWLPLIKAKEEGNKAVFDEKFEKLYGNFRSIIYYTIRKKYRCDENIAEDCVHEAYFVLLSNIANNKEMQFNRESELYSYLYTIARHKAIELLCRIPHARYISDSDYNDYTDTSKYFELPSGNVFRDVYDGRNDIDAFLRKDLESFKLLDLKIIQNLSYKEILALEEYSKYSEVTLRQKVSRSLKKYKDFLKE